MAQIPKTGHVNNAQLTTGCFKYGRVLAEARAMAREIKQWGERKPATYATQSYGIAIRRRQGTQDTLIVYKKV